MIGPKYPECEKLAKVSDKSQTIGAFLEWLQGVKEIELAKWSDSDGLYPEHTTIESLLAEYFEIDMNKVEKERQQILEDIQNKEKKNA